MRNPFVPVPSSGLDWAGTIPVPSSGLHWAGTIASLSSGLDWNETIPVPSSGLDWAGIIAYVIHGGCDHATGGFGALCALTWGCFCLSMIIRVHVLSAVIAVV